MRIGLFARAEERGLGHLTREWHRHVQPDKTLIVVPPHDLPLHTEWYRHGDVERLDLTDQRTVPADRESFVRDWLADVDVLYSAETMYDWRICDWARRADCRTVCHLMPEYWPHASRNLPSADVWWVPTRYRLDHLPPSTRVVAVPVALDRFGEPTPRADDEPIRWLHVAGAPAHLDRNGTNQVLEALGVVRGRHDVTIAWQGYERGRRPSRSPRARVALLGPVDDYWRLYDGCEALLFPRRYAGVSLPALEAMAAGLALVMTDVEPQRSEWPIVPIPTLPGGVLRTVGGTIDLAQTDPRAVAATMDRLNVDRDELAVARDRSRAYAESHSWAALLPTIRDELARAAAVRHVRSASP